MNKTSKSKDLHTDYTDKGGLTQIKPVRIQRSRQKKQVSPNGLPIVYAGRPSKWGNPFKVGDTITKSIQYKNSVRIWNIKLKTIRQVLKYYNEAITDNELLNLDLSDLKGKNLSCWCKIGEPCHADILLKLANR